MSLIAVAKRLALAQTPFPTSKDAARKGPLSANSGCAHSSRCLQGDGAHGEASRGLEHAGMSCLVSGKSSAGEPEGLAPSMGRAFAEKLGVPVEYVQYESADKLADDAKEDKWDVAMIGADPARAEFIDFTPPYCQIEATLCCAHHLRASYLRRSRQGRRAHCWL